MTNAEILNFAVVAVAETATRDKKQSRKEAKRICRWLIEQTGADGATLALDRDGGMYALWVRGCCIEIRCVGEPERTWVFRAPVEHPWVDKIRAWLDAGVDDDRFCATVVFEILGW